MITFIIFILFFVQKKQRGFTHDLQVIKSNYEKELIEAQMEIQEHTCKEISQEIHDNVCQMISLAKLGLGTMNLDNNEESGHSVVEITDILDITQDVLRNLSRTLNTGIICKGGLKKSIESQVEFIRRRGKYNIQMEVIGESMSVENKKDPILFRMVQEAINNIIKHAIASEICISLQYNHQFLELQIKDNGKGFDQNEHPPGSKALNGIHNMQHRASLIDAEFSIESQLNKGTLIKIKSPY